MKLSKTRSPSSALYHPNFGGGFPYYNRLQEVVGALILTSLLEDLEKSSAG